VPQLVVLTDLDGSLLDHATYSFEAAREALTALQEGAIPLIIVSSKTRAEIEPLRARLHNTAPFVVENGGGLYIPPGLFDFPIEGATIRDGYHVIELGLPYTRLRAGLKEIGQAVGHELRGFGDMSAEEIAERTGLSHAEASLAKQREYDEPLLIEEPAVLSDDIRRLAEARGLHCTRGGRFYHLMGNSDKGRACRLLLDCYRRQGRRGRTTILAVGIGDSLNDLPMLAAVDRPVLVQRPDGSYDPNIKLPNLILAPGIGPTGWNHAILQLLTTASSA
jgi:mannosyl-3-phosphoglycerate phosphatase